MTAVTEQEAVGEAPASPEGAVPVRPASVDRPESARVKVPDVIRNRLYPPLPRWDLWAWVATAVIGVIAGILRFVNLDFPRGIIFDEVYYVRDGLDQWQFGTDWDNEGGTGGAYVVHPPLGKILTGFGQLIFNKGTWGDWEFGWRFMGALCGTLSVIIMIRVGRRMFRSTVLGCAAGLLMALDGMQLVLSRTALLDIFQMFFIVAAFGCLIMDRDSRRLRWLRALENGLDPSRPGRAGRPVLTFTGVPWWRLATGVMLGCAVGVKWSALYFLPAFLLLMLVWEVRTRRSAGVRRPWRDALIDETGWIVAVVLVGFGIYLLTWSGWFITDKAWYRHWLSKDMARDEWPVLGALRNLLEYHIAAFNFHDGLTAALNPHPYQSYPWQWPILGRPVLFYWNADPTCGTSNCQGAILLLGTPVLWWSFVPALVGLAWFGISRRDWRAAAIGLMIASAWLPWFYFWIAGDRVMFYFYALPMEPFFILAIVYVLGSLIRGPGIRRVGPTAAFVAEDRRIMGVVFAGIYMAMVALCFWWFYPLYVGESIPAEEMARHMWMSRWL